MPKDATKNVDRYKIRGGQLNEFDFHQNQEDYATKQRATGVKATNATKGAKGTKKTKERKAATGATAKKLAARKAAKKK